MFEPGNPHRRKALLAVVSAVAGACTPTPPRFERRRDLTMNRSVTAVAEAARQPGHSFLVARLSESMFGRGGLDPFIAGDEFLMGEPTFPPHPHAGFSAVTWMFEDGDGAFTNRDTFSPSAVQIDPGALHWTAAGRGMMHEEVPTTPGRAAHGLQLFVDLPAALKQSAPGALHLSRDEVTVARSERARVRVLAGAHADARSALAPPTAVTLLDAALDRGGRVTHRAPPSDNVLVWVRRGAVRVNGSRVAAHQVARLAPEPGPGDEIVLEGEDDRTELIVLQGRPLRQPVIAHGPFVGASREEVRGYIERYQRGEMGRLPPSFTR